MKKIFATTLLMLIFGGSAQAQTFGKMPDGWMARCLNSERPFGIAWDNSERLFGTILLKLGAKMRWYPATSIQHQGWFEVVANKGSQDRVMIIKWFSNHTEFIVKGWNSDGTPGQTIICTKGTPVTFP